MTEELTRNQRHVLDALRGHRSCRTAYELLDELRAHGIGLPPSVYRALHALTARGLVHRVESRNAFVACRGHRHAGTPALALCRGCGAVEELEPAGLGRLIGKWCRKGGFAAEGATVEISGLCGSCQPASGPPELVGSA